MIENDTPTAWIRPPAWLPEQGAVARHRVGTRAEWAAARDELLAREKEHTRLGDELARQRRELPWVAVEKDYRFDTDEGPLALADLFAGRSQLLIYHFMFGPSYQAGCPVNSSIADSIDGSVPHLAARDVTMLLVSQAPLPMLQAYKRRMGWDIPWVSSAPGDFNGDLGYSISADQSCVARRAPRFPSADRRAQRQRQWHRPRRLSDGEPGLQRVRPRWRRGLPDVSDLVARARVPHGLLPDPGSDGQGPR
jgi:predicted dithiol-disulfide oxidoreductase (DUF899 family)